MKRISRPRRKASKVPPRILFGVRSIYLPARITGANVSIDALCRRLLSTGFDPIVVYGAGAPEPQARSGVPPTPAYPVIPLADPVAALAEMVTHLAPSAVVLQGLDLATRAAAHKSLRDFPVRILLVQNFIGQGNPGPAGLPHWRYAANSRFLGDLAAAFFAAPVEVVPPLVEPSEYRVERAGQEVLFVNPVADKGVHIAAAIAERLPHRRFLFVSSWPDHAHHPHVRIALPNVSWADTMFDMRPLYARARIALMPSLWEETWGRVAAEAQVSGIPVVASDRGNLRETVGPGGFVLPLSTPIEGWCRAVESLFADEALYEQLSQRALRHARRRAIAPPEILRRFLRFAAL
jgi:glycosyltransferase involved in cell wall biosynthesis